MSKRDKCCDHCPRVELVDGKLFRTVFGNELFLCPECWAAADARKAQAGDDPRRPGKDTEDLRKRLRDYWECTADCRPPIGENKCLCALLNEAADALEPKVLTAEKLREMAEKAKERGAVGKRDRWA